MDSAALLNQVCRDAAQNSTSEEVENSQQVDLETLAGLEVDAMFSEMANVVDDIQLKDTKEEEPGHILIHHVRHRVISAKYISTITPNI